MRAGIFSCREGGGAIWHSAHCHPACGHPVGGVRHVAHGHPARGVWLSVRGVLILGRPIRVCTNVAYGGPTVGLPQNWANVLCLLGCLLGLRQLLFGLFIIPEIEIELLH